MRSRIDSVGILKKLRFEFPENSKYRFQYVFGMITMSETIDNSVFLDLNSQLITQTGCASGLELVEAVLPEMDKLLHDFPQPRYEDACNMFRLTAARVIG